MVLNSVVPMVGCLVDLKVEMMVENSAICLVAKLVDSLVVPWDNVMADYLVDLKAAL